MRKIFSLFLVSGTLTLIGCGQNIAPIQLGADPTATPDMGLPLDNTAIAAYTAGTFTGFNATTQGFQWSSVASFTSVVKSPVAGVVSVVETGQTNNTNSVTIYFNARYSIKVSGITNLQSVRVGDYVAKGATIGNAVYTGTLATIKVIVYQDGVAVCPLTFFDSTSRAQINTSSWISTNPCPI